jgi:hypothetical protein
LFSKKALKKLIEDSFKNNYPFCQLGDDEFDDVITGKSCFESFCKDFKQTLFHLGNCLGKNSIFVNELDELNQKRFFPLGLSEHLRDKLSEMWYKDYMVKI